MVTSGLIVCFAGKIGSGKTSITEALSECLGWTRVGFGDYVRAELARRGGNPENRLELQDLGQDLVDSDVVALCRSVLTPQVLVPGGALLVDGIRHAAVYQAITELIRPSRACLVFLQTADEVRMTRAHARGESDFLSAEVHRAEAELDGTLPAMADVVIDASGSFQQTLLGCLDALSAQGIDPDVARIARQRARLEKLPDR